MPGLHEKAVRADVPFAVDREALGEEWGLALKLGPPEMPSRLEQPLPSVRCDGLQRGRTGRRQMGHPDQPFALQSHLRDEFRS